MVEGKKLGELFKQIFFTVFVSKILRKKREGDPENFTYPNMLGEG